MSMRNVKMKETRELLGELLDEAMVIDGEKRYYLDKSTFASIQGNLVNLENPTSVVPQAILDSLKNFPSEVRTSALSVYMENKNDIDNWLKANAGLAPTGIISIDSKNPWQEAIMKLHTGDRAGAIGKGEALLCLMFPGSSSQGSNQAGFDVTIQNQKFSVKFSDEKVKTYKLNGVIDDILSRIGSILDSSTDPVVTDFWSRIKDSDFRQKAITVAAAESLASNPNSSLTPGEIVGEFLAAGTKAVVDLSKEGGYDYAFCSSQSIEFVLSDNIKFYDIDVSQSKIGIRKSDALPSELEKLVRRWKAGKTPDAAISEHNKDENRKEAVRELMKAYPPDYTTGDLLGAINARGSSKVKLGGTNLFTLVSQAIQGDATLVGQRKLYDAVKQLQSSKNLNDESSLSSLFAESRTRGSTRKKKSEVSTLGGGSIRGVQVPMGRSPDGKPDKRTGNAILRRNAKMAGKFWGGAKPVNESNGSHVMGGLSWFENGGEGVDADGDGDVRGYETKLDTASVYRGGGGDMVLHAKTTGRAFAGAIPVGDVKVRTAENLKETRDLLWELLGFEEE
jgi:hypothetical protein